MSDTTITSANSVFTITVPGLFPAPVQLKGYSAEKAWSSDQQELAEVQMGVDGRMTSGYVPNPVSMSVSLQADSPSKAIFNAIAAATKQGRNSFYITGAISLPSTGEAFSCIRGVLKNVKALPDAAKVLQPMEFSITWEDIRPTLL
jgi:hypothetical protein